MKKNIFKLFAILFVTTIGFISCTEEEIVKADYDYIQNPANVPANVVSVAVSDTSVVTASVSGTVPNDPNLLDWGVVYYTADMVESGSYLIKSAKDTLNNYSFKLSLSGLVPNTNYTCKAFAMNNDGITYGAALTFETKPAQNLPFELKATDPAAVWSAVQFTKIDADGDGKGWGLGYLNTAKTEIGLISYSWYNAALTPENYIILPPLVLSSATAKIDLGIQGKDSQYFAEKYKVIISTTPIVTAAEAKAAKKLFEEVVPTADRYVKTITIPAEYKNKVVWIGIAHYDCTDMYALQIPSIRVY